MQRVVHITGNIDVSNDEVAGSDTHQPETLAHSQQLDKTILNSEGP